VKTAFCVCIWQSKFYACFFFYSFKCCFSDRNQPELKRCLLAGTREERREREIKEEMVKQGVKKEMHKRKGER